VNAAAATANTLIEAVEPSVRLTACVEPTRTSAANSSGERAELRDQPFEERTMSRVWQIGTSMVEQEPPPDAERRDDGPGHLVAGHAGRDDRAGRSSGSRRRSRSALKAVVETIAIQMNGFRRFAQSSVGKMTAVRISRPPIVGVRLRRSCRGPFLADHLPIWNWRSLRIISGRAAGPIASADRLARRVGT
jgi:hypothetical protein